MTDAKTPKDIDPDAVVNARPMAVADSFPESPEAVEKLQTLRYELASGILYSDPAYKALTPLSTGVTGSYDDTRTQQRANYTRNLAGAGIPEALARAQFEQDESEIKARLDAINLHGEKALALLPDRPITPEDIKEAQATLTALINRPQSFGMGEAQASILERASGVLDHAQAHLNGEAPKPVLPRWRTDSSRFSLN